MSRNLSESERLQKLSPSAALQLAERLLEAPQAAGVIDNDDEADDTTS